VGGNADHTIVDAHQELTISLKVLYLTGLSHSRMAKAMPLHEASMKTNAIAYGAALLLAVTLTPVVTQAGPLETFSFVQSYPSAGGVTGTFTGAVEPGGSIQLADLTAFSATYTLPGTPVAFVDTYSLADLQLFSFFPGPNGPNSSLDIFASVTASPPGSLCVGAAAAFGACGPSGSVAGTVHVRYAANPFLFDQTTQFANVTFIPAPVVTSEPAMLGLTSLMLPLLISLRGRGRRSRWR
jgi:hypothetical protein